MPTRRTLMISAYMATAVLGAWAIVLTPALVLGHPQPAPADQHVKIVVITASALAAIVWAFYFSKLALRRSDEFFRAAEKVSWYWGGLAGFAASLPVFAFIALGGLHWIDPASFGLGKDLFRAFVIGYFLPIAMQFAGFVVVRVWWPLSKR